MALEDGSKDGIVYGGAERFQFSNFVRDRIMIGAKCVLFLSSSCKIPS